LGLALKGGTRDFHLKHAQTKIVICFEKRAKFIKTVKEKKPYLYGQKSFSKKTGILFKVLFFILEKKKAIFWYMPRVTLLLVHMDE
jgi:hypothetical protein